MFRLEVTLYDENNKIIESISLGSLIRNRGLYLFHKASRILNSEWVLRFKS